MTMEDDCQRIEQQCRLLRGGLGLDITRVIPSFLCKLEKDAPSSRQTQPCARAHSLVSRTLAGFYPHMPRCPGALMQFNLHTVALADVTEHVHPGG